MLLTDCEHLKSRARDQLPKLKVQMPLVDECTLQILSAILKDCLRLPVMIIPS